MMNGSILFSPILPLPVLAVLAITMILFLAFAIWRRLTGWPLRALGAAVLLAALANPSYQQENREALSDIVLLIVDKTASQMIGDRPDQTQTALDDITAKIKARANTELRISTLNDADGDSGSLLITAINNALAEVPRDRVAGIFVLTDGQIHDTDLARDFPAPVQALLTGHKQDWDRRLTVKNAPAFAILGEEVTLTLRVDNQGNVPETESGRVKLSITIDGGEPKFYRAPIGKNLDVPVSVPHAGMNVIQFTAVTGDGELTDRNNTAVIQINGVRDRLRVLLVSGQPHTGERTWRNLLKSDSSVDLVHFTILRPPDKQDGVPVSELSLIAFPVRELFLDKINDFDLIIFDRYKRRGILPVEYYTSVRDYVEQGGALMVAAGPDFASVNSIYRTILSDILPARPTARVIEQGFKPAVSPIGQRHPVTEGLEQFAPGLDENGNPNWGRWMRLIEVSPLSGQTVMTGAEDRPLLILDRVGDGRVALLASDQSWLWDRGFEGGGPQLELLRRLAHWMMKEPELEEESLWVEPRGQQMKIIRRTLGETVGDVEIIAPDGAQFTVPMKQVSPGRYEADFDGPQIGLYHLDNDDQSTVIALGPSAPREFEETIATAERLAPITAQLRGAAFALENGMPVIRNVRMGRAAAGRGWMGITPRGAYLTSDLTITPLVPAWLTLLIAAMLVIGAWLHEGRR